MRRVGPAHMAQQHHAVMGAEHQQQHQQQAHQQQQQQHAQHALQPPAQHMMQQDVPQAPAHSLAHHAGGGGEGGGDVTMGGQPMGAPSMSLDMGDHMDMDAGESSAESVVPAIAMQVAQPACWTPCYARTLRRALVGRCGHPAVPAVSPLTTHERCACAG